MSKESLRDEGRLFSREEAKVVREQYAAGKSYAELARIHGCGAATISAIVRYKGVYAGDRE